MMVMRFKEFNDTNEGRSPTWVKVVVGGIVLKIRGLDNQIKNEDDPVKQNILISKQNKLISYISGLGIGFSSDNKVLQNRMKTLSKK